MRAGELTNRVVIRQPADYVQSSGQPTEDAPIIARPFVSIEAVSGGESIRGMQVEAGVTSLVKMHFRRDLTPRMRIEHEGRTMEIVSAYDPTGKRIETWCQCKEVA